MKTLLNQGFSGIDSFWGSASLNVNGGKKHVRGHSSPPE